MILTSFSLSGHIFNVLDCGRKLYITHFYLQGMNSFVRESRKAVICELVNLQEMVDVILAGKSIRGGGSTVAESVVEDMHGDGFDLNSVQSLNREKVMENLFFSEF